MPKPRKNQQFHLPKRAAEPIVHTDDDSINRRKVLDAVDDSEIEKMLRESDPDSNEYWGDE